MKAGLEATEHPTSLDLAWAAGVFEGEGSITFERGSARCQVAQKDEWLLHRLKALFGGTIVDHINTVTPKGMLSYRSDWKISGARARGFLMTMYSFLSPRRKSKIREVLGIGQELEPRNAAPGLSASKGRSGGRYQQVKAGPDP